MPNPSSNIRSRPDSTTAIVGDRGEVIFQASDGTILTRDSPGEDADWSFIRQNISNDEAVATPQDVGGTSEFSGAVRSVDDKSFSVEIDWQDGLGNALFTEAPPGLQNIDSTDDYEVVINQVKTKSPNAEIRIVDESSTVSNRVTGTINFH